MGTVSYLGNFYVFGWMTRGVGGITKPPPLKQSSVILSEEPGQILYATYSDSNSGRGVRQLYNKYRHRGGR